MTFTLLVQNNGISHMTCAMGYAAQELDIPIIDLSTTNLPEKFEKVDDHVFLYGSHQFLEWGRRQRHLHTQIRWDEHKLSPHAWVDHLGDLYMNHDGHSGVVSNIPEGWYARPIRNDKSFNGGVGTTEDRHASVWAWVSPPKDIEEEVRIFVVGRTLVEASYYMRDGKLISEATDPLKFQMPDWLPFDDVVVDLGLTKDGWKVIEFNSIHTSGLYGCSAKNILKAMRDRY